MSNKPKLGWVCPVCKRVWAPWMEGCKVCNETAPAQRITVPAEEIHLQQGPIVYTGTSPDVHLADWQNGGYKPGMGGVRQ